MNYFPITNQDDKYFGEKNNTDFFLEIPFFLAMIFFQLVSIKYANYSEITQYY